MATYSTLETTSFTDLIVPFNTFNGISDISTGSETITGYTLDITKFKFTPDLTALENTQFGISPSKLIWDFGDGTTASGFSVEKHYQFPGEYIVTTILTDQTGKTHKNKATQKVKIFNYMPDALQWYTPTIAKEHGGQPESCICGVPSDDLTIYRYNSWQSWPMVSGDGGYYINLYAQGSLSRPLSPEQYWSSSDIHYVPSWRFVRNKESTVPIERVQTDYNTDVYVKLVDEKIVHTIKDDTQSVFAGTSGYTTVNYIDDNSNRVLSNRNKDQSGTSQATFKNTNLTGDEFNLSNTTVENKDIILFAGFDTSKFPATESDRELNLFETLKKEYFQVYEMQKVGLPIIVKLNTFTSLNISSNGIKSMPITRNKYINSPISFSVRTAGPSGNDICTDDIPPLSSRWEAPSWAFSGGDITTDVLTAQGFVTLYLSGEDTKFTRVIDTITSSEDFKRWDVGEIRPENDSAGSTSVVNSLVVIRIADRIGSGGDGEDIYGRRYARTNRTVTLLSTQLSDATRSMLEKSSEYELKFIARSWQLNDGKKYYGILTSDSKYNKFADGIKKYPELKIDTSDIITQTYGTYAGVVNLDVSWDAISGSNKFRLFAETKIDPPTYFNVDVQFYYLANPTNDVIHQIKPVYYRQYSYGEDGYTQTYTPPITTVTPGNSGLYGCAVDPEGNVIMVDGDTDKIVRYWRNMDLRTEIPIHSLLPDVSANHYPGDPDQYGYSPSSVCLDKNLDYWVTLYDTVSTIKIDGKTDQVIACAVPPEVNYLADVRQVEYDTRHLNVSGESDFAIVEVDGLPGEYGENLIVPTCIETCRNNDIIVTYSNTLCSFVVKYDSNGKFLYKFDIPGEEQYFPGELCVDVSDHAWIVAEETGLNPDGTVKLSPPKGRVYSLNEKLEQRLVIDSVAGADFQDMLSPTPSVPTTVRYDVNLNLIWDYNVNAYVSDGMLIESGPPELNPELILYEDNTYIFNSKFFNQGEHALTIRQILPGEENQALSGTWEDLTATGDLLTENVSGFGEQEIAIHITSESPSAILLVDDNYFQSNKLVLKTKKKKVINSRLPETFDLINNPTYVVPDAENNIWFSWGPRYCSRYNVRQDVIDMTVAVGSAYYDPRFHPLSAETHDRRDNTDRRSAIEGIGMDTGNNLLVVNNADKRVYAINSDTPPVSAYINITTTQQPYESFTWVESICSSSRANNDDFLLPTSYLTDEQIKVFLNNVMRNEPVDGTARQAALENYVKQQDANLGDITFRTAHGSPLVKDVGFEEEIAVGGDWTGFKWINKFDDRAVESDETSGTVGLTGSSDEFILIPQRGYFDIFKTNEDVDFAGVIREYIKQPNLKERAIFYDEFLNTVFGTTGSSSASIGKKIYEKISNFSENNTDIDVCTINALKSLAQMTNYKLKSFGTSLPSELERMVDLLSIKLTKLKGSVTNFQSDFEKYGNWDQDTIGVNLGPELVFIYDYDENHGYNTNDIARYQNEYYECIKPATGITQKPAEKQTSEHWRWWPDGFARSRHYDEVKEVMERRFLNITKLRNELKEYGETYGDQALEQEKLRRIQHEYDSQNIVAKYIRKLFVEIDKKYVLKKHHSDEYLVVTGMTQNWAEQRDYNVTLQDNDYVVSNPFSGDLLDDERNRNRRFAEYISDIGTNSGMFTLEDNTLTLLGDPAENPTVVFFYNRTYRLHVDSPEHPVEITTNPGTSGQRLDGFVSNQGTEFDTMVIKTDEDPIYGKIPKNIYYQSTIAPEIGGSILVTEPTFIEHYSTEMGGVTGFYLDISFNKKEQLQSIGWGIDLPKGENAWQYYSVFEYKPDANTDQSYIGNVIDWTAAGTTLEFDELNDYNDWTKNNGSMDILIEKTLRSGLDLFAGENVIDNENYNNN